MNLSSFDKINKQLKDITNELAYHVVGDPLVLSNLEDYLNISLANNLKVNLTTTANNISKKDYITLMNKSIKQINFSLNSYNANSHKKSLDEYLDPILDFIDYSVLQKQHFFINLRIWNLDNNESARNFNFEVFKKVNERFNCNISIDEVYKNRPKNIRIGRMIFFNFDDYFNWPSLNNEFVSNKGFCYGLDSHFAILSSGTVVPCCLDKDAVINLGNTNTSQLKDILKTSRVQSIKNGFKNKQVVEELCQKCEYRIRFDK